MGPLFAAMAAVIGFLACWELLSSIDPASLRRRWQRELRIVEAVGKHGLTPTRREKVRLVVVLSSAACVAGLLVSGVLLALVLVLLTPAFALLLIQLHRYRYKTQLQLSAPVFARALIDPLRAGLSVRRSLSEAADSLRGPIANELHRTARGLELGETVEGALSDLRARANCPEFDALTTGILLQRDAGGDLVALLTDLSESMEASVRVRREAKTATSQARFTAGLLLVLPVISLILVELASPGYLLAMLANPISMAMTVASFALQIAGIVTVAMIARVAK